MAQPVPTTETAHTEVAGEHEATLLGLGAEGWVYVGVTIFLLIAIFVAKAHKKVVEALDAQIAETRRTLDDAASIRKEAEALLASAKTQHEASAKHAAEMIDHARHEAEAIVAKAETDTTDMIARREKMATDKIEAAERAAVEVMRAQTAGAATRAARALIAETHDAGSDRALVDAAIADIGAR
jgi:F-type H+-transporting ATPase subunit b